MHPLLLFLLIPSIVTTTTPPRLTKYNETLSEMLLSLSAAAYARPGSTGKEECIQRTFPASENRSLYSSIVEECDIVTSTCESFIVTSKTENEAIVVFRGTKKKIQLLMEGWEMYQKGTDFNGMGRVNSYFLRALNSLWKPIEAFLNDPLYKSQRVIFTGHSLGGALASLAAAQTVMKGHRTAAQTRVYTFGQPRIGSYRFAQAYEALKIESYRIIYGADLIPHQPPCQKDPSIPENEDGAQACLAGREDESYHQGTEIWYPGPSMARGSLYLECLGKPVNEDFNCSNMLTFTVENKEKYMWDHRHYFDVSLSNFGKSGCKDRTKKPPPKKSTLSKLVNAVTDIFSRRSRQ